MKESTLKTLGELASNIQYNEESAQGMLLGYMATDNLLVLPKSRSRLTRVNISDSTIELERGESILYKHVPLISPGLDTGTYVNRLNSHAVHMGDEGIYRLFFLAAANKFIEGLNQGLYSLFNSEKEKEFLEMAREMFVEAYHDWTAPHKNKTFKRIESSIKSAVADIENSGKTSAQKDHELMLFYDVHGVMAALGNEMYKDWIKG